MNLSTQILMLYSSDHLWSLFNLESADLCIFVGFRCPLFFVDCEYGSILTLPFFKNLTYFGVAWRQSFDADMDLDF